jgi:uncharacterized membrane protein YphA (DoxX/SURF4 family)
MNERIFKTVKISTLVASVFTAIFLAFFWYAGHNPSELLIRNVDHSWFIFGVVTVYTFVWGITFCTLEDF